MTVKCQKVNQKKTTKLENYRQLSIHGDAEKIGILGRFSNVERIPAILDTSILSRTIKLKISKSGGIQAKQRARYMFLFTTKTMKFIKHLIVTIIINALLLYIIANHVPQLGFHITSVYQDSIVIFLVLGIMFWIVNSLLRSILKALTLPVKYMTLGVSGLIINVLLLYIFEQLVNYSALGVTVQLGPLGQTFILSIIVTVVHLLVKKII